MQKCAPNDKRTRSIFIEDDANDRPKSEEKEDLQRGNPGNRAARVITQWPDLIVLLKASDA